MLQVTPNKTFSSDAALAANENKSVNIETPNWFQSLDFASTNWNQSYPYQLRVYDSKTNDFDNRWVFTLPIAPQLLNLSLPFANHTQATLGGVVTDRNAAPLRPITIAGTTGLFPLKNSAGSLPAASPFESVFAGTVNQLNQVTAIAKNIVGIQNKANVIDGNEFREKFKSTGYYQFRMLKQFLERFEEYKKRDDAKHLHLAFCIYKDEAIYLVDANTLTLNKTADSPLEYKYNLSMTAFARVANKLKIRPNNSFRPAVRSPDKLSKLLTTLLNARRLLFKLKDTLAAVIQDFKFVVFEPLRQTTLFLKELMGVPLTFVDLPTEMIQGAQSAIINFLVVQDAAGSIDASFANSGEKLVNEIDKLIKYGKLLAVGESDNALTIEAKRAIPGAFAADPANEIFATIGDNPALMDAFRPSSLMLFPGLVKSINKERQDNSTLDRADFQKFLDQQLQILAKFESLVGLGNDTFSETFGLDYNVQSKQILDEYYDIIFSLNEFIQVLSSLAASSATNDVSNILNSINFIAGLATRSGIAFQTPVSKYKVPFIYGMTIEKFSEFYLGDPDRWIEIVTLNGLQSPYVDEVGYTRSLLVNGSGNQIQVSSSENLVIGQVVTLISNAVTKTQRILQNINVINEGLVILTLSGEADLDQFKVVDQTYIHFYLPNTVNSQMTIFLPSQNQPDENDFITKDIPGLDENELLFEIGGVDFLLSETFDLIVTNDGDSRYATGLVNIIQYTKIILNTVKGTVQRHLDFGIPSIVGQNTADVSSNNISTILNEVFTDNTLYNGVKGVIVRKQGPGVLVSMSVGIKGLRTFIPVSALVLAR